jgi:hypothetical protein
MAMVMTMAAGDSPGGQTRVEGEGRVFRESQWGCREVGSASGQMDADTLQH